LQGHWVDNEAAHQAFMRQCRIEVAILIGLIVTVPLATAGLVAWKLYKLIY
jgi:hypothetical protein